MLWRKRNNNETIIWPIWKIVKQWGEQLGYYMYALMNWDEMGNYYVLRYYLFTKIWFCMIIIKSRHNKYFNTSYLTDSYIVFILKLESGSKITIFGLKMVVKSGLEKFILKSLHAGRWLFSLLNLRFCAKLLSKMN